MGEGGRFVHKSQKRTCYAIESLASNCYGVDVAYDLAWMPAAMQALKPPSLRSLEMR